MGRYTVLSPDLGAYFSRLLSACFLAKSEKGRQQVGGFSRFFRGRPAKNVLVLKIIICEVKTPQSYNSSNRATANSGITN